MSRIHPVVAIKLCNTFHGNLSNTFLSSFTASGKVVDWYTDKLTLTSLAYKQTKKQETHDWHQSALWFTTTLFFQVNPSETMHNKKKKPYCLLMSADDCVQGFIFSCVLLRRMCFGLQCKSPFAYLLCSAAHCCGAHVVETWLLMWAGRMEAHWQRAE